VVYTALMGEVTAWPSEEEAHAYDMAGWLELPLAEDFQEDQHFHEDNEYEEEGWEWGPLFGFSKEGPAALPIADCNAGEELVPIANEHMAPPASGDMLLVAAEDPGASGCQQMEVDEADDANDDEAALAAQKKEKKAKYYSPRYWQPPAVPGVARAPPLDPLQSQWVMEQLAKWQNEVAGGDRTRKPEGKGSKYFYSDMMCDGIDAGALQPWHSQDICYSHIRSKVKK
jgi:hypothetical protein